MDKKAFMAECSELMLEGWAMLSRTCPNDGCHACVLLGNRSKGEIQCVNCKSFFITEEDAARYQLELPADPEAPKADDASDRDRVDAASARIGELMLQGWSMLADTCPAPGCPGVPLLRKRGTTGKGACVLCEPGVFDGSAKGATPVLPLTPALALAASAADTKPVAPSPLPAAADHAAWKKVTSPLPVVRVRVALRA